MKKNMMQSILATTLFCGLTQGHAMSDELVWHPINVATTNSGNTTGATNFMTMETMLRDEAMKICGVAPSVVILIKNLQFSIARIGAFSLTAEGCQEATQFCKHAQGADAVTSWTMYPPVAASAEIACAEKNKP